MRDFRGATITHRQNDHAEATADVNLRTAERVETFLEAHFLLGAAVDATDQGQANLAAVSVARQNEVDAELRGIFDNAMIVREQDGRRIGGNATHGAREVGAIEKVVDAGETEFLAAAAQGDVAIAQDLDALAIKGGGDSSRRDTKVVVSEDGEDAVAGTQGPKHFGGRLDVIARTGNEISRKRNDVRFEFVGQFNGEAESGGREIEAMVNVGKLDDAKAVKRFGQIGKTDAVLGHFDARRESEAREMADAAGLAERVSFHAAIPPAALKAMPWLGQSAAFRLWKNVCIRHSNYRK